MIDFNPARTNIVTQLYNLSQSSMSPRAYAVIQMLFTEYINKHSDDSYMQPTDTFMTM